ncbi:MAG: FadR/GntR family transcriptional regulator [Dorea sp.]
MAREEKAYARVIEKVKKMILSGELKPGEKLPPEREFAEELEVLAFTLALDRVREEDLAKMEECVEKLDKNGDSKNNATLDKIIHYTLARASGNQLLIDILEACSGVFDILIEDMRYGILKNENRKTELNECHRHLVDALREGDREKGLQALKWHFEMIDEVLG